MNKIESILIRIWKLINNFIYFFIKFNKTRNKVAFISRQTNFESLDFNLIIKEIKNNYPSTKIIVLNKMIDKGILGKIKYAFYIYYQMYHIATSKVVVIDGYCIPICTLKHKKKLKIIQIWHALGALKKFGYSVLDRKEGSKTEIANSMDMHRNYTYILTSSKSTLKYFKEAFNAQTRQMKVIPLPRVDFLKSELYKEETIKRFYDFYPMIKENKKKILYVPTFRKNMVNNLQDIIKAIDYKKYDLVIKTHDEEEIIYIEKDIYYTKHTNFTGLELLHIADYVITDYSAIVYEAAVSNKPVYFYNFDYENYIENRGFYIDYKTEMPGLISKDIKEIIKDIEKENYDYSKLKTFKDKYIDDIENCTKKIVELIMEGEKISNA